MILACPTQPLLVRAGDGESATNAGLDSEEVGDDADQGPGGSDDGQPDESGSDAVAGAFSLTFVTTRGEPLDATPDEVNEDKNTGEDNDDRDTGTDEFTQVLDAGLFRSLDADVLGESGSSES